MTDNELIFVGLGSNLGNRRSHLRNARTLINKAYKIIAESTILKTRPVGVETRDEFLNQVVQIYSAPPSDPETFLQSLLQMEKLLGRDRRRAPNRIIDLDLLYWGSRVRENDPILPHPRVHQRRFVLNSMVELAPEFEHPVVGRTQWQLLEEQS